MQANVAEVLDVQRIQKLLDQGDLRRLFVEELGWDILKTNLDLQVGNKGVRLSPVAQKRELGVFEYLASKDEEFPSYAIRASIESAAAKLVHEHLIIFSSHDRHRQVWQWAKREIGRPIQRREQSYHFGRRADLLIQKLGRLIFSLQSEEEGITVVDVAGRLKAGFDVQPITKRFYDGFQAQHEKFLDSISGIRDAGTKRWYASIMLNRLMFVYFVQEKGFLHSDPLFLQTKLAQSRTTGVDKYLTEYLLPFFFDCLAKPEAARTDTIDAKFGKIPFLNGGLFKPHEIEIKNPKIRIPDTAFAELFSFFESYRWHLDERPISEGNEINPDVLGYIFERYINQAQMGAYYTKEDITEYIATFAILPRLIGMISADAEMAKALEVLWQLVRDEPKRYVFAAMQFGIDMPLPDAVNPNDVASAELGLATETWAEAIRRRENCNELLKRMTAGAIRNAGDCLRENIDLRQIVQDALERSPDAVLLEAVYDAVTEITVLDPACGSGAFLFAAMNVLEPIYEACLEKMAVMLDVDHLADNPRLAKKFADIVTHSLDKHPNQQYFILKQLALRNLYGVDIMEEAVEICKLRLFLKLISQVDRVEDVEPLPDIDFNVKGGNSLVGFVTMTKLESAAGERFDFGNDVQSIRDAATEAAHAFDVFRDGQSEARGERAEQDLQKQALRDQLGRLQDRLNHYSARQYGIDDTRESAVERWRGIQQPFHWLADFFGIMAGRRFDVVIGNPPYVVFPSSKVDYSVLEADYYTLPCKNLYALMYERALQLVADDGVVSFIVQLTVTSSERVPTLQKILIDRGPLFYTSFPRRPQTVFEGVEMPVTIVTSLRGKAKQLHSTRVERFYAAEREHVMSTLSYLAHDTVVGGYRLAKMSYEVEREIFTAVSASKMTLEVMCARASSHILYYQEACRYWAKVSLSEPFAAKNGIREFPAHWRKFALSSADNHHFAFCLLNSSLFYWYYSVFSDCEHINDSLVKAFPIPATVDVGAFRKIGTRLDDDLRANANRKMIRTRHGDKIEYDELTGFKSKPIIDEVDRLLASVYGLSAKALTFIQGYDSKYRLPDD